jgi:bacillithiol biosynthesis cysteine-adding enzyme BshC
MDIHCLPAHTLPHTTKLYANYLTRFRRIARFYGAAPTLAQAARTGKKIALAPEERRRVVEVLREQNRAWGADAAVATNLDRLGDGAAAVVTGQQVGLLTGPAYSFYKALTAIRVARELTRRGTQAVPVFWLATEDHDLAEVNHAWWLERETLRRFDLGPVGEPGSMVGGIPLGGEAGSILAQVLASLRGPGRDGVANALHVALHPEQTLASCFAQLFTRILAGHGLILLDPRDGRLQQAAAPVFRKVVSNCAGLTAEVLARNQTLEKGGFHAQVKVVAGSTPVFLTVNGKRVPLRQQGGRFTAAEESFSEAELLTHLASHPEDFSGNALLRPVVQDALLPTAAIVAGPAEIAYFAQAEVLFRAVLGRMPVVLPRAGFTLVEPHVERLLKRYGMTAQEVITGGQVRQKMEGAHLTAGMDRQFAAGEKALRSLLERVRPGVGRTDKTLQGAVETAERKILYQWANLRAKTARAAALREGLIARHEEVLRNALHPQQNMQERVLCLMPFLAGHGLDLLGRLEARALRGDVHQVAYL